MPKRIQMWATIAVVLCGVSGCNWFVPLAFVLPEPKEIIPAEFTHLKGTVTVLVWTPPELAYEYPQARLELAAHVVDRLQRHVEGVDCQDPYTVEDYLARYPRGRTAEEVGRQFQTEYVVYAEVLDFGLREPGAPDLVQGRLWASVVIHELKESGLPVERFELEPIKLNIPEGGPVRYTSGRMRQIRKTLYLAFADRLVRKFHEYEEVIK
jgi:hypothetical protein